MGWLSRLFGRGRAEPEREPTFDEVEGEAEKSLSERYSEQRDGALTEALDALDEDGNSMTPVEEAEVPVEFHVVEAEPEDLLTEEPMEDHYTMATGDDVDPKTADSHFTSASSVGDDMTSYEKVEVPVSDDDFEVISSEE